MNYQEIKRKINIYRRRSFWSKERCIFIHVPKAAGTSISNALYGRPLGHYSAMEIKSTFPGLFDDSFKFSFVRNPWARVLSAYRFAKQGRTESMGIHLPEQYDIPEFRTFESFLMDWLPSQSLSSCDPVFRPQIGFVLDHAGDVMVDYIGRVESLDSGIQEVECQLGRHLFVRHSNSTSSGSVYQSSYKSNEMIEMVAGIYREDITKFGYSYE